MGLYLLFAVISLLMMTKPAQASGSVAVIYPPPAQTTPLGTGLACFTVAGQAVCGAHTVGDACNYWNSQFGWSFQWTGKVVPLSCNAWICPHTRDGLTYNFPANLSSPATCPSSYIWNPVTGRCTRSKCPDHASSPPGCGPPTSCTCDDNYLPDPTGQSCVPVSVPAACPDHASRNSPGASCVCDDGYKFDAAGTSCISACPIPPFPEFSATDLCSQSLEKGAGKDVDLKCDPLNPEMVKQEACLADKIHRLGIPYTEPSATVRTEAYQQHLVDIWKWNTDIKVKQGKWSDAEKQACAPIVAKVKAEMDKHKLDGEPSNSGANAPHVLRKAVDIDRAVVKAMREKVSDATYITFIPPFAFFACRSRCISAMCRIM